MSHSYDYIQGSKILVIDDEPQMRKLLQMSLSSLNLKIIEAQNGREGLEFSKTYLPDLIILDMNLGDMAGHAVLKSLRETFDRPVIILSVEGHSDFIVKALHLGADDYITKPFDVNELIARIHVCLRRTRKKEIDNPLFKFQNLEIDFIKRIILVNDQEVKLTTIEYDLLKLFVQNQGKVLTHRHILKEVWGPSNIEHHQYPRVYVRHLRKKIEEDPNFPKLILTEPGIGYRFLS